MAFNIGAFPLDSVMFDKYGRLFEAGKTVVVAIMPSLIIARASWNMISAKGTSEYWEIIKDTVLAVILLACFMSFLRFTLDLPGFFSSLFGDAGTYEVNIKDAENGFWSDVFGDVVNGFTIVSFWFASFLYIIFLLFMSTIAAYIIVFGTMLRSTWILKAFFWILLLISSWPLFWYIANMCIRFLSTSDGFINGLLIIFFNLFKAISPLVASAIALKSPLASAAKSVAGGTVGMIGGAKSAVVGTVSKLGGKPIIDNLSEKKATALNGVNSTLSKTIPAMGKTAGAMSSLVGKGYKSFAPSGVQKSVNSLGKGMNKMSSAFKNSKDLYSGKEIPHSSPARLAIKNAPQSIISGLKNVSAKGSSSLSLSGSKPPKSIANTVGTKNTLPKSAQAPSQVNLEGGQRYSTIAKATSQNKALKSNAQSIARAPRTRVVVELKQQKITTHPGNTRNREGQV